MINISIGGVICICFLVVYIIAMIILLIKIGDYMNYKPPKMTDAQIEAEQMAENPQLAEILYTIHVTYDKNGRAIDEENEEKNDGHIRNLVKKYNEHRYGKQ